MNSPKKTQMFDRLQTSAGGGPVLRVRAILRNPDGEFLVVRHKGMPYYSLPGGKVDAKESAEIAVLRELEEEMAVVPQGLRLRYILEIPHINSIEMYFVGEVASNKISDYQNGTHAGELDEIAFIDSLGEDFKPPMLREMSKADIFAEGVLYLGVTSK